MEKELNIVAILKDKPNARLYDELHNIKVELDKVSTINDVTIIRCKRELPNKVQHFEYSERGTERGWLDGLQILKPSQKMRDWSKFAWKKGDVLQISHIGFCTFEEWTSDDYTTFKGRYGVGLGKNNGHDYDVKEDLTTSMWYKVNNKDFIKEYLSTVEKRFGGKLNLDTLEIEKPRFKDGDIVVDTDNPNYKKFYIVNYVEGKIHSPLIVLYRNHGIGIQQEVRDRSMNMSKFVGLATEEEKQNLFDALAKENKAWDAEKKAIVDLPKKCGFKPMDWCLMRDIRGIEAFGWSLCQYAYQLETGVYEAVGGLRYNQCIPYNDQTAHLLGTSDDWKGGEG